MVLVRVSGRYACLFVWGRHVCMLHGLRRSGVPVMWLPVREHRRRVRVPARRNGYLQRRRAQSERGGRGLRRATVPVVCRRGAAAAVRLPDPYRVCSIGSRRRRTCRGACRGHRGRASSSQEGRSRWTQGGCPLYARAHVLSGTVSFGPASLAINALNDICVGVRLMSRLVFLVAVHCMCSRHTLTWNHALVINFLSNIGEGRATSDFVVAVSFVLVLKALICLLAIDSCATSV